MSEDSGEGDFIEVDLSQIKIPDDPRELFEYEVTTTMTEDDHARAEPASDGPPPEPLRAFYDAATTVEQAQLRRDPEWWARYRAEAERIDAWLTAHWGDGRQGNGPEAGAVAERSPFIDLRELDDSDPIVASVGRREDGSGLLYAGAVNGLIGDPEQGKSLAAAALAVQVLTDPHASVVWLDLDHNGPRAFRKRVEALGLPRDALAGVSFAQAEDRDDVMRVVRFVVDAGDEVKLFVVDSLGELLPMFGASSDSADDYTRVHREVLTRAASAGAAVLTIDHLAKGSESRAYGGTGTIAKKRAVDGALYRVEASKPFAPGAGGAAGLRLLKDRHGSVRSSLPDGAGGTREPVVTRFDMSGDGSWTFAAPGPVTTSAQLSSARLDVDVDLISKMSPPPTGYRDVQDRLKFGTDRARAALKAWRERTSGAPD